MSKQEHLKVRQSLQLNFMAQIDCEELDPKIVTPSLDSYKQFLIDWSKTKAFVLDLETYANSKGDGLDPFRGSIRLIQIGLPDERVLIFDVLNDRDPHFFRILKQTMASADQTVILHNAYFDLSFLKIQYGLIARKVRCTKTLSQVRWAGIKSYRHSLAAVSERLFGIKVDKKEQVSDWGQTELSNSQLNYAAKDVVLPYKIAARLSKEIDSFNEMPDLFGQQCKYTLREIALIECECIPAFVEMGSNGLPVNIEVANQVIDQYKNAIEDLFKNVSAKLMLPYSAQSEKLAKAIYDVYGIWLLEEDKSKDVDEEDDEDALEAVKSAKQLSLFKNKEYPAIPEGFKLTTSSACLFNYYVKTKEEDLLILSLTRSLKKSLDALITLRDSALQNDGFAKTRFNSLGNTSTGRSTSSGVRGSSLIAQNLQNLPNHVQHQLLKKYNLPHPRIIIQAPDQYKLSIQDLSAAHSRICADLSKDPVLLETMDWKDPHQKITSTLMKNQVDAKWSVEYIREQGGKDHPLVAEYRSLGKTCYYLALNVGSPARLQSVMAKDFKDVSLEDCEATTKAFQETFPDIIKFQRTAHREASKNIVSIKVKLKTGAGYNKDYAVFRTPDGRLIHLEAFKNDRVKDPKKKDVLWAKISDVTSCQYVSAEAICEKKTAIRNYEWLLNNVESETLKMLQFTHDEFVYLVQDSPTGVRALKQMYKTNAEEFALSLNGVPSGMVATDEAVKKTLAKSYNEK